MEHNQIICSTCFEEADNILVDLDVAACFWSDHQVINDSVVGELIRNDLDCDLQHVLCVFEIHKVFEFAKTIEQLFIHMSHA